MMLTDENLVYLTSQMTSQISWTFPEALVKPLENTIYTCIIEAHLMTHCLK